MTEMKARLVDKDGNPLGTAANPLKISDHSISTATWGSITGTLSDQTDLNAALNGKASKTESDLTLYVYEDVTGDADGSSKANAYTTLQDAIDAIPDVAQNVTVIVCKGSTNYLGQTTTIQKASVKSLTIQGEFYAYEACDANAVAGKVVDADADFSDFEVGDRVVCTHYSGTVESSSIDDYFYATITEVGEGYIQTSEETKVPTTGWKYLINQTVFDGNDTSDAITIKIEQTPITLQGVGIYNNGYYATAAYYSPLLQISNSILYDTKYSVYGSTNDNLKIESSAIVNIRSGGTGVLNYAFSNIAIRNTSINAVTNTTTTGINMHYAGAGGYVGFCGFFACKYGVYAPHTTSIRLDNCYLDATCTTGAYGYNITLSNCTNNATTPVYNLTSGGSIEEWDGQALPSIDDATGGQVLALKSDKSSFEFASKQPLDATLTALAGLTTAANKLPYATGEDTFGVCDFTPLGQSLIGTTTASAVRDLIASASGSTTTKTLYVYGDATGTGDGTTKANGFTTLEACLAAMPDIINHAYVIKMCAAAAPYASTTVQKTVGAGSITIEGEFYKNGTVASAGSTVGKFNTQAGDTGAASGDKILMIRYSGTVGSSTPSDAFIDTVAGVSGTEITLTTRTSDAFDTSWRYVIVRTVIGAITAIGLNNLMLVGLNIVSGSAVSITGGLENYVNSCIFNSSGGTALKFNNVTNTGYNTYVGINQTYTGTAAFTINQISGTVMLRNCAVMSAGTYNALGRGMIVVGMSGAGTIQYCRFANIESGTLQAAFCNENAYMYFGSNAIDGVSGDVKMAVALIASNGGTINCVSPVFGSNITTQKSPANWAASTDGSYIS